MSRPTVHILVSIPDSKFFDSCTLCFDTIRTGFPTANILVHFNTGLVSDIDSDKISDKLIELPRWDRISHCWTTREGELQPLHHAYWIKRVIENHAEYDEDGPCIILDADTLFWKSCEDWKFPANIAGYYVPYIWNDFAQCPSMPRLHTSFLWINDTKQLLREIKEAYPNAYGQNGDYCPCEPFMPTVRYIGGLPYFWDSCANLYGMVGGTSFGAGEKACYEHLNSASFFKVMYERIENKKGFELLHTEAVKHPEQLRGQLWPLVDAYYAEKHAQVMVRRPLSV